MIEIIGIALGCIALLVGWGYLGWMIFDSFRRYRRRPKPIDYSTDPPDHLDYRYIAHLEADLQVGAYDPLNVLERIRDDKHAVTAYGKTFRDVGGLRADRIQTGTIRADRIRWSVSGKSRAEHLTELRAQVEAEVDENRRLKQAIKDERREIDRLQAEIDRRREPIKPLNKTIVRPDGETEIIKSWGA